MLQCFCTEALYGTHPQSFDQQSYNFLLLLRELILCSWWKLHQQDCCRSRSEKMLQSWKYLGGEAGCTSWPLLLTADCCSGQLEIKACFDQGCAKALGALVLGFGPAQLWFQVFYLAERPPARSGQVTALFYFPVKLQAVMVLWSTGSSKTQAGSLPPSWCLPFPASQSEWVSGMLSGANRRSYLWKIY